MMHFADLGAMTADPWLQTSSNFPNISASLPQLKAVIAETPRAWLCKFLPTPRAPRPMRSESIKTRYDAVKGSAVNPVLREGNSDRRAPKAVKEYARANPHRLRAWSSDSKTHVAHMDDGDFFSNEQSKIISSPTTARIEHEASDGSHHRAARRHRSSRRRNTRRNVHEPQGSLDVNFSIKSIAEARRERRAAFPSPQSNDDEGL